MPPITPILPGRLGFGCGCGCGVVSLVVSGSVVCGIAGGGGVGCFSFSFFLPPITPIPRGFLGLIAGTTGTAGIDGAAGGCATFFPWRMEVVDAGLWIDTASKSDSDSVAVSMFMSI